MDQQEAQVRLIAERSEVQTALTDSEAAGWENRLAEDEKSSGISDPAQPLTEEGAWRPRRRPPGCPLTAHVRTWPRCQGPHPARDATRGEPLAGPGRP